MKNLITSLLCTIVTTIVVAQNTVKQEIKLEQFNAIDVSAVGDVILAKGEQQVILEASENELKRIKAEVLEGTLKIYPSKNAEIGKLTVYVSSPDIKKITLSGIGSVRSNDTLKYDNLDIKVTGAGGVELIVDCSNLKTKVFGAGDINLSGKAIVHEIDVRGAGDIMAFDLETEVTNARVSGAGDIHVNAVEELNVKVSGAGDVFLKGEPKKKNIEVAGAGEIYSMEDDTTNTSDTTKLKFKKHKFWIITDEDDFKETCDTCKSEKRNKHWAGLELGVNGYMNASGGLDVPATHDFLELNYAKSYNVNLNFLEKGFRVYDEYAKVVTGLGLEFNSYSFDNNTSLIPNNEEISAVNDSLFRFSKNKLNTTFINIPLMVAFNTNKNPKKAFHISAGMVFGYRIGTKYKQKYVFGSENYKNSVRSDFNLMPYRYGLRASVGYSNFNIYASYALSDMFQKNEGPELHPFTLGLKIIPF